MNRISGSQEYIFRNSAAATLRGLVSLFRARYSAYACSIWSALSRCSTPELRIRPAVLRAVYAPRLNPKKNNSSPSS